MKKLIFLISASFVLISINYSACSPSSFNTEDFQNSTSLSSQSSEFTGQQAFAKSVYLITSKTCIPCHVNIQAPFHASSDLTTAYLAAKSRVSWANVPSSKLIMKIQDGHCGNNNCKTDGSEMTKAINFWKAYEMSEIADGGTSSSQGSDSTLPLSGRRFVQTRLDDIFGPTVVAATSGLIANSIGSFGGPCDKYKKDFNGGPNYGDCKAIAESQASLIGPAAPSRQSLIIRACEMIAQNDSAIKMAVTNAIGSDMTSRLPTQGEIQSLYELFYTGKIASTEALKSYNSVSLAVQQKAYPALDSWRFVLFTMCSSPDWQIP